MDEHTYLLKYGAEDDSTRTDLDENVSFDVAELNQSVCQCEWLAQVQGHNVLLIGSFSPNGLRVMESRLNGTQLNLTDNKSSLLMRYQTVKGKK